MKSFSSLLSIAVAVGALHTVSARAAECVLPVCEMKETLAEFKSLRETRRFSFIEQMTVDYTENKDVSFAKNLIEFGTAAKAILDSESPKQEGPLAQVNLLLDQSNTQLAVYSELKADILLATFRKLQVAANRFTVISTWAGKIADLKDAGQVRKLREFFAAAYEVTKAAGDEEYVVRAAALGEQAANAKIIELNPNGPAIELPIKDMKKTVETFRAQAVAERYLLLKTLTETYATTTNSKILVSLEQLSKALSSDVLKNADANQELVVKQNAQLLAQTIDQLSKNADLSVDDLINYYRQVGTATARFAVVAYWANKVTESSDLNVLRKLVVFFGQASKASIDLKDEEFVSREATAREHATNQKIIDLGQAPAFQVPIADMAKAVAGFKAMTIPNRFLLVKQLSDDHAKSTNSKALISILEFARAIAPALKDAGETQAFILAQDEVLVAQTIELLARNSELTADALSEYFKQLAAPASRLAVIQFWGEKIDTASKAEATKLVRFFQLARRISNSADDDEYIPRAAQQLEQRARQRAASL
jgi:hypothetical protein